MKNDTIQGIVFDKHRTITFRDPPKNFEKVPYYFGRLKQQLKNYAKQQSAKRHKATFNTDLLPAHKQSTAGTVQAVDVAYSATTDSGVVVSDFTTGAGAAGAGVRRSTTRVVLR